MPFSTASKLTKAQAYQHCMRIAQQHYENFPTASRLIQRKLRPAVAAIYAFARAADDMADEGNASAAKRLKQIDAWESLLERCVDDQIDHPVFLALGDAINRFHLPVESLYDLLIAFRMDVSIHSYATRDELMFYCRHSANPVGRLMLALHGITDSGAQHYSDALCTALQLTNFWQDLSRDIPNGRCYLAQEWLEKAGFTSEEVLHGELSSGQLKPALAEAYAATWMLFQQGAKILPLLPFRLRLQIAATLYGGMAILQATTKLEDPLNSRPALTRSHWYGLAGNILVTTLRPSRPLNMEIA
ncbi:MAG: squalene synthase HpnC [Mariprofundaceae bacterium]|nr:squalene synthase HpnC [Mariprofundaceae bacterium]